MRRALHAALAGTLLLSACTTRERLNPLDPKNSQTLGGLVGFNAIAGNGVVELKWPMLTLNGLVGYRVQRWTPGGTPVSLGTSDYAPGAIGAEDSMVANDSTYAYRLVAHLENGDSAVSVPDTVTPGVRSIFVLEAEIPALSRISSDSRDIVFRSPIGESYIDMEVDTRHQTLWVAAEASDLVMRKNFDGATVGTTLPIGSPGDVSVSNNRGVGWVASLSEHRVVSYGPDLNDPTERPLATTGNPRVVEAGTIDPFVWVGSEEGVVTRFRAQDGAQTHEWSLGAGLIRAIAIDESTGVAWAGTRSGTVGKLFVLDPSDSSSTLVRSDLLNVADLAVDQRNGDLWISERGSPGFGAGRLSRMTRSGATLATVLAVEPYGIVVDPLDGSCWATDLRSSRILRVDPTGTIFRTTPVLQVPYAVRVVIP